MAFVGGGMGIPTVSRHRQGRDGWPGAMEPPGVSSAAVGQIRRQNPVQALSSGAVALGSSLHRPAAWKLATAPERTETAGAFQHISAAAQAERSVRADAGSRLHRETHVALLAQARLALDPVPISLNCHGSV